MSLVMVLHLKAILTLVCLNRLVILRMCGEVKVKIAYFVLFPAFLGCSVHYLFCVVYGVFVFCNVEDGLPLIV